MSARLAVALTPTSTETYTFTVNFVSEDLAKGSIKGGYESVVETETVSHAGLARSLFGPASMSDYYVFEPPISSIKNVFTNDTAFIPAKGYKYIGLTFDSSYLAQLVIDPTARTSTLHALAEYRDSDQMKATGLTYSEDGSQYGHKYFVSKDNLQRFCDVDNSRAYMTATTIGWTGGTTGDNIFKGEEGV